jgi:hypothetical protein
MVEAIVVQANLSIQVGRDPQGIMRARLNPLCI